MAESGGINFLEKFGATQVAGSMLQIFLVNF